MSPGKSNKIEKTVRYKLYEMGHYAGSVVLEIGLRGETNCVLPVLAAREAGSEAQYYGVESQTSAVFDVHKQFKRRRLGTHAVFFRGSMSEFRNAMPITPTMVIVNEQDFIENVLNQLSLFLADGTPILVKSWFRSRSDLRSLPQGNGFELCGRFGESILLRSVTDSCEQPSTYSKPEFVQIRNQFGFNIDDQLIQNRESVSSVTTSTEASEGASGKSDKKWPFAANDIAYPATLPDGTPWPAISIITPTYNQGQFIEQTINSVLNQGYPNLEYIVIDGASTDETPEILDRYRRSFDLLISEADEGQSDAINKGMALARGEILTWLNSDDMLTPGTLYAMAMAFWKSKADMVVGAVQFLKDGEITGEHLTSCENGPLQLSELLDLDNNWLKGRFFFQPELMFTRDLWERAGGYVDKKLYYSMDHELWLRFAIAGANMHIIGRPTVIYRVHDQQKTHDDYQPELRTVNQRYIEKYGVPNSPLTTMQPRKYRATFVNDVGVRYGAGIAHGRLRDSMDAAGHETSFVFAKSDDNESPKTEAMLYSEIEKSKPDLVVFGNLHNASLGMGLVDHVSERWPTCFVMHDLWMSTGRCGYLGGCEKYKSNCDSACPTSSEYPALNPEHIEAAFESKLKVISKPRKIVVMANSEWTKSVAEESAITSKAVLKTLKYGFPTHIFKPRNKQLCREILGLPPDAFIVLFTSVNVAEERKGLNHLFEALNRLQLENLLPVCIGYTHDQTGLYPGTISLGYVDDPWRNAIIYSAADIFVGPSLQEAFGQVFIEAAACGTPSIGYPVGGVENAIEHGVTGRLTTQVHPSSLADEILRMYRDTEYRRNIAVWGRIEVENEWSYRSAYHHFNNLLRQVPEHIGFSPPANIAFDPAKTHGISKTKGHTFGILEKKESTISPDSGFAEKELIQIHDGSQLLAQWAVGTICKLQVRIMGIEKQSIVAECFNPVQQQTISVYCNGAMINTVYVKNNNDFLEPSTICLLSNLQPGDYQIQLEFSDTIKEQGGSRELSMLFADIRLAANDSGSELLESAA